MDKDMASSMIKIGLGLGIAAMIIGILVGTYFSYSNTEIRLRNSLIAQQESCEAYYDKLWKIISQKAQVAAEYKESFGTIYQSIIAGRYGNEKGGTLMRWIQEANPNFDISLYKDVSQSIEAERNGFFLEQKKLIDLDREHKTLRQTFPGSLFIGGRSDVSITIVKSETTEAVYRTGQENDVNVFKK